MIAACLWCVFLALASCRRQDLRSFYTPHPEVYTVAVVDLVKSPSSAPLTPDSWWQERLQAFDRLLAAASGGRSHVSQKLVRLPPQIMTAPVRDALDSSLIDQVETIAKQQPREGINLLLALYEHDEVHPGAACHDLDFKGAISIVFAGGNYAKPVAPQDEAWMAEQFSFSLLHELLLAKRYGIIRSAFSAPFLTQRKDPGYPFVNLRWLCLYGQERRCLPIGPILADQGWREERKVAIVSGRTKRFTVWNPAVAESPVTLVPLDDVIDPQSGAALEHCLLVEVRGPTRNLKSEHIGLPGVYLTELYRNGRAIEFSHPVPCDPAQIKEQKLTGEMTILGEPETVQDGNRVVREIVTESYRVRLLALDRPGGPYDSATIEMTRN